MFRSLCLSAPTFVGRYLTQLVSVAVYPLELQMKLNKANTTDTDAPFLDFWIYIFLLQMDLFLLRFMINAMTFFHFWMVTFLIASYGVYISELIRFA